jgi:hypothetical protein
MKLNKAITATLPILLLFTITAAQERLRLVNASLDSNHATNTQTYGPTYIPAGSRIYVAEIEGLPNFENNLVAALQKKRVDLIVVTDRALADFEVRGFAQSQNAGWAKIIFGSGRPESEASIQLVNLKTGVVAYAVASYKVDAWNGNKSTAEHLAKNLRQKMERDQKRWSK